VNKKQNKQIELKLGNPQTQQRAKSPIVIIKSNVAEFLLQPPEKDELNTI